MQTSEQINELATALAKAQGAMHAAEKDATNPHFGKSYATLAAVMDACRMPLANNGLSVIQPVEFGEGGGVMVITRLMHSSGQFAESSLLVPLERNTAQAVVSASTYGRRVGLSAMVGVVPDEPDDDGNAAEANAPKRQTNRPAKETAAALADEVGVLTASQLEYVADCTRQIMEAANEETLDTIAAWIKDKDETVRKKLGPIWLKKMKVLNPNWTKKEKATAA